jgi:hypothetical protein
MDKEELLQLGLVLVLVVLVLLLLAALAALGFWESVSAMVVYAGQWLLRSSPACVGCLGRERK